MTSSLFSALSGMRVHQQWIDVIGNNLANANTPGYKTSRAVFADALTQTLRSATGPSGTGGGRNPVQIGLGVVMASVGRNVSQGALTTTGRIFDLALEGGGFFALSNGEERFYTRVGTFGLDAENNLVDQRTGMRALDPLGQPVEIDTDALFPPKATEMVSFGGNLPAVVTGPLSEVLTGQTGLEEGSPAILSGSVVGPFAVTAGATYSMTLTVSNGVPQQVSVTDSDLDGSLTAAEVASAIDALNGVSAAVNAGAVQVTSDRTGDDVVLKVASGGANDLASTIGLPTALAFGSEVDVSSTTDLNALPASVVDYVPGDRIEVVGVDTDGSPVNAAFEYGVDGTTVGELMTFIDGLYADANVSLNSAGQIVVEAQTAGEAELLLTLVDQAGNTGSAEWFTYNAAVTTEGTGPDTVTTSAEVFDGQGTAHTVTLTFERQQDLSWNLTAEMPPEEGTVLSAPITGVRFNQDGTPIGLGLLNSLLSVQFTGQTTPQNVELDLGSDGSLDGLTQFGAQSTAYVSEQDGYSDGQLSNLSVDSNGAVQGFYTNGQSLELGTVGVAVFANPEGLAELANNLWVETGNSGTPNLGTAGSGSAGNVVGGALENSNVDTAEQFVRLIEAQRGFQANARVISTQDEVLAEVVNLI